MKQDFDTYTTWMSLDKILLKKTCLIENTLTHTHTHTYTHTHTHTHCIILFMCKAKNRKPHRIRMQISGHQGRGSERRLVRLVIRRLVKANKVGFLLD